MRTLIYKRTHNGDPDPEGRFGIDDCMGRVRSYRYDAVIGIGGGGSEAIAAGINHRVNWIGIGPQRHPMENGRGDLVTFKKFIFFDKEKPVGLSRALAKRMYSKNPPRYIFSDNLEPAEIIEIRRLLKKAENADPSVLTKLPTRVRCTKKGCRPRKKCPVCSGDHSL